MEISYQYLSKNIKRKLQNINNIKLDDRMLNKMGWKVQLDL